MLDEFTHEPRTAYFSMEIALLNEIPTYSGGLGILAGDTIRSAADLELPMVAVSLASRSGYFKQEVDSDGCQLEQPASWEPASLVKSFKPPNLVHTRRSSLKLPVLPTLQVVTNG